MWEEANWNGYNLRKNLRKVALTERPDVTARSTTRLYQGEEKLGQAKDLGSSDKTSPGA